MLVGLDEEVGNDELGVLGREPGAGAGVEAAELVDRLLDRIDVDAGLLLDRRQAVLLEVVEVVGDQDVEDIAHRDVGRELEKEALAEVPGADAGRVELLNQAQGQLGLLGGGLAAEVDQDLAEVHVQEAVVVQVVDDELGDRPGGRVAVEEPELIREVVVERLRSRRHVLHGVVLAVGLFAEGGAAEARAIEVGVVPIVLEAVDLGLGGLGVGLRLGRSRSVLSIGVGFGGGGLAEVDQDRVLDDLLVDPLLQRHQGELEDLHRLDHPGRHAEPHVGPHLLGGIESHDPFRPIAESPRTSSKLTLARPGPIHKSASCRDVPRVFSETLPAAQGVGEHLFVGELENTARGQAAGESGDRHAGFGQSISHEKGGAIALQVGIGREDQLADDARADAGLQGIDGQMVGPDPLQGRQPPEKNVINARIRPGTLQGHQVAGLLDHADQPLVAPRVAADGAKRLVGLGQVEASLAVANPFLDRPDRLGQGQGLLGLALQDMMSQPLGRLGANAGQATERLGQAIQGPGVSGHRLSLPPRLDPKIQPNHPGGGRPRGSKATWPPPPGPGSGPG